MIRVLQCVNDMHRAGLETMLMNYYRNIDRSEIQFDFLTHRPNKSDYDDEIESLGGKVYYAPRLYPQNYKAYFKYMKEFYAMHPEYKIVHSHIDSMSYLPLLAAKKAGIPVRIAHSHNTSIDKDFKYVLKQYFRFKLTGVATHFCTCGKAAGEFLFPGKECVFIPNAIEPAKFKFDDKVRTTVRNKFGWDDNFVLGHVGRLSYQKNHKYLLNIFKELVSVEPKAILVLIGTGEKEVEIRKLVEKYNLTDKVIFLGNRSDVNILYQAMDVFVMPSHFEGVPVVGIEAQFSGIPCIFSDNVPEEVKFNDNVAFLPLKKDVSEWVDYVLKLKNVDRQIDIKNSIYDIHKSKDILTKYYINLSRTPLEEKNEKPLR